MGRRLKQEGKRSKLAIVRTQNVLNFIVNVLDSKDSVVVVVNAMGVRIIKNLSKFEKKRWNWLWKIILRLLNENQRNKGNKVDMKVLRVVTVRKVNVSRITVNAIIVKQVVGETVSVRIVWTHLVQDNREFRIFLLSNDNN